MTKKCKACGAEVSVEARFCPKCGNSEFVETQTPANENTGFVNNTNANPYGMPNQPIQQNGYGQPAYQQQNIGYTQYDMGIGPIEQNPMKWFKFIINFSLFAGAFINFVYGVNYITGGIYFVQTNGNVTADMVYSLYEGLQIADIVYGIFMIVLAGFNIYTRFRLAKYKANGPTCLYIVYGVNIGMLLLYSIIGLAITGLNTFTATVIGSIAFSAVFLGVNISYFKKRKALFVN